jgi:hypothetical protein
LQHLATFHLIFIYFIGIRIFYGVNAALDCAAPLRCMQSFFQAISIALTMP